MSVRLIRYVPQHRAIKALAEDESLEPALKEAGNRIADSARSQYEAHPPRKGTVDVEVLSDSDSDRQRVAVIAKHPAALALEAEHRVLGTAVIRASR